MRPVVLSRGRKVAFIHFYLLVAIRYSVFRIKIDFRVRSHTVMMAAPVFSSFGSRAESPILPTATKSPEKRVMPDAGTASVNPSGLHA